MTVRILVASAAAPMPNLANCGVEVVANVWFSPSRLAHSLVSKVLAPIAMLVAVATPMSGVVRVKPAKVKAALALLIAT